MASCGSLRSLFETPLPENPTLMESLSAWNQIKPKKPLDPSSFTELFGELHFQERSHTPPSDADQMFEEMKPRHSKTASLDSLLGAPKEQYRSSATGGTPVTHKSAESLMMCTEGLGSESSDDVDDMMKESDDDWVDQKGKKDKVENGRNWRGYYDVRAKRGEGFPPPISSIGRSGKPWVCFKSYREGGRFVLREIRIPSQEFLHASREDGRLKLHFMHPDEDIAEGEEEQEEEGEEQDKEEV
ncbi:uncharacterized protein [Typha latifolia]|uniref:uncharacterized protein n=1 Tax=Typha latifolia TaxID=4733 RepID=UPI003C307605